MDKYLYPVTPAEVSNKLQELIKRLVPGGSPVYVQATPLPGAPQNECFPIVEGHVEKNGGTAIFGWSLWELPTLFVEAEFHAVWRRENGDLLDIAPKSRPTRSILFLVDPNRSYQGHQLNNVRMPVRPNPIVEEYLNSFDAHYEFMNRGDRAKQHGEIRLGPGEAAEYQRLTVRMRDAAIQLFPLHPTIGPYGPCPCGSGKKVRWCCKSPQGGN